MTHSDWDRTVHAGLPDGGAIARYDRAGKWYVEWPPAANRKRLPITVKQAAGIAEVFHSEKGAFVHLGRYGGQSFTATYRKHVAALAKAENADAIRAEFRRLVEPTP